MLTIAGAPFPQPLLGAVQELEVETAIDMASVFRLRLANAPTATGDWTVTELDPFRPLVPLSVRIQSGSPPPRAVINGYVTGQDLRYGERGEGSTVEITGSDATVLMSLEEKVATWPSMPDGAVAAAIFAQYTLVPKVTPTAPSLIEPLGTPMQRGSDIRHLRMLAKRNGFDCYVAPEPLTGVDVGHFEPRSVTGLPQAVLNVAMGTETNVSDFHVRYDMLRPTAAIASGLDTQTKSPAVAVAPASLQLPPLGAEPALARVLPPPQARPGELGVPALPALQTAAQALVDERSWAVVAEGRVAPPVGVLTPGGIVTVRGAGREHSGAYLVTRVHHSIGPDGYEQRFEARRNAVTMTGLEPFVEI